MKNIIKILALILALFSFWISSNYVFADDPLNNVELNTESWVDRNDKLSNFWNDDNFFNIETWWVKWAQNTLLKVAKDLKDLFFWLATLYLMIIVIKVLFANNTEEEVEKFKKWIIWTTIWILVMQSAYAFVRTIYAKDQLWAWLAFNFIDNIVNPIIGLLEVFASIFFLAIAIMSFYKLITANWDEEKVKSWKMSIFYAVVWFILIKLAKVIVEGVYGKINCSNSGIVQVVPNCIDKADVTWFAGIMLDVLNWINSFIWIVVVIMIIYTWAQVLLSAWDEEKLKKAKTSILYIAIWLAILAMNYLIITFFILPESPIWA